MLPPLIFFRPPGLQTLESRSPGSRIYYSMISDRKMVKANQKMVKFGHCAARNRQRTKFFLLPLPGKPAAVGEISF